MGVVFSLDHTIPGDAATADRTIAGHVHPGGDLLVLVAIRSTSDTVSGITADGNAMSQIVQSAQGGSDPGPTCAAFRRAMAAGTFDIVIDYSSTISADAIYVCSVSGHDPSSPIDSSGSGASSGGATVGVTHARTAADTLTVLFCARGRGTGALSFAPDSPIVTEVADTDGLNSNTISTALYTHQESASGSLARTATPSATGKWASVCVSYTTRAPIAQSVSASGAGAVAFVKQAGLIVSAASSGSAAFVKQAAKVIAASGAASVSVAKGVAKAISAASAGAVSAVKQAGKSVAVAAAGAVSVLASSVFSKSISVVATGAVTVSKVATKAIGVAGAGVASVAKVTGKVVAASIAGGASLAKDIGKQVIVPVTAAVGFGKFVSKSVSVAVATLATVVKSVALAFSTAVSSSASVSSVFRPIVQIVLAVAITTGASLRKNVAKRVHVVVAKTAQVAAYRTAVRVVSASCRAGAGVMAAVLQRRWPTGSFNVPVLRRTASRIFKI